MENKGMIYFTSDTHYFHKNIMHHAKRPWETIDDMHEGMVYHWNKNVSNEDIVYHLGDFAFRHQKHLELLVDRLQFKELVLLKGNHDDICRMRHFFRVMREHYDRNVQFTESPYLELKVDVGLTHPQKLVLNHYGQRVWNNGHHGAWHLHGHSHGNLPPYSKSVDVGVDSPYVTGRAEYRPYSFEEISEFMKTRTYEAEDHHQLGVGDNIPIPTEDLQTKPVALRSKTQEEK